MRVLLTDDGSHGAAQGVALADSILWPEGSVLRVASVIEPLPMTISGPWSAAILPSPDMEAAIAAHIGDVNRAATQRLEAPGRLVEGVLLHGRAASAIVDEASATEADLVIVGARGHGQIATLLLGSVSSEIVDQAPCPVLVARGDTVSQVVFATDGSPSSLAAEALLAEWPIFAGVPIRVVSVAEVFYPWTAGIAPTMYQVVADSYAADLEEAKEVHQRLADETAVRLRAAGRTAEAEMRDGSAAAEILAVAAERQADLVILGTRGRTGLTRLLLGSVARNVLSGSPASVLVVRDRVAGAASGT